MSFFNIHKTCSAPHRCGGSDCGVLKGTDGEDVLINNYFMLKLAILLNKSYFYLTYEL